MKSQGLFVILLLLASFLPSQAATITAAGAPVSDAQAVLTIVNQLDFPADWKIYVAGEKQWAGLMDKVDHTSALAVTDRQKHITVIRALALTDPNVTGKYVTAKHVLAHELGHIVCNCDDEWKAENYAHKHE
jgi:hypothetical protein